MIEVKNPVLLNDHLSDSQMLHPSKGSLKLNMSDVNEATLTLPDPSETIGMHKWVKIYNQLGFVGIFRRTSVDNNVSVDSSFTLRHGIDILQDSVYAAQTDFAGTKAQFLSAILDQQTQLIQGPGDSAPRKPWTLGSCADTSSITQKINYDNLLDLMKKAVEDGGNYYFSYDQSSWPWTVSIVAKPSAVASEFRLNRNMEKCKIKDNDSELCTRLILNLNHMEDDEDLEDETGQTVKQNVSIFRTYNNTSAQAAYGIIVKTADIDVSDSLPDGPFPEADAFAADFLARRAAPQLQIQIDGDVLAGITCDTWDESRIATVCRVSIPDYAIAIEERVVTVTYPDMYGTPDKVTVNLANALKAVPSLSRSMKEVQTRQNATEIEARETARSTNNFKQHFAITDTAGNILKQAGMELDADGLLVYADDMVNMVGAKFNVQADQIGMVVGTYQGQNYIKAGEICLAINATTGESMAKILANHVIMDSVSGDPIDVVINGKLTTTDLESQIALLSSVRINTLNIQTLIDAPSITGTLAAIDDISCDYLSLSGSSSFDDCIIDAEVNSNVLTLTKASGTTVTFSKATDLSGAWGSRVFTVKALQSGTEVNSITTTITIGTPSWNNKTVSIPISATVGSGATVYSVATATATYSGSDYQDGYDDGYDDGWNDCLNACGIPYGGTVYTGTWRGTLYVAPSVGAQAVNNCVGGATGHQVSIR